MKLFLAGLFFLSAVNYSQQADSASSETAAQVIITDLIYFAPSAVLTIMFHELGHYTFAKIAGASNPKIGLFRRNESGGTQLGWTSYGGNMSSFGSSMVNIGGVLFSRGLAESSHLIVKSSLLPNYLSRFFSMTYLFSRIDMPRYILQDALLTLFDHKGSDIDQFVTSIAGKETGLRTLTYFVLLAAATVDFVFDWDKISRHWKNMIGKSFRESSDLSRWNMNFFPEKNGGVGIVFSLSL